MKCGADFFGSLPRFIRKGFDFRDARGGGSAVRSGGAGLGGVLTPVGLGTIVAEGKQIINVDGKDYLLEKPLRADVALLGASLADRSGNLVYKGTSQNFNPLMATAADLVIAEVRELVETGAIAPEAVRTPGIFVDYMVAPAK